jgi:hypothetical protein
MELGKSWLDKLSEAQPEGAAREDPWKLRLERLRGKLDYDGLERVTTQMLSLRFRSVVVKPALVVALLR